MTSKEIIAFAKQYTHDDDYGLIKYDNNAEEDNNYDFRILICKHIKDDFSLYPDELIIDLYTALSDVAKATFSVYNNFHLFANEVLKRGHIKYLDIYIDGATKSFDTLLASGAIELERNTIIEIIAHLKTKMNHNKKYVSMLNRFEVLLEKAHQ